MNCTMCGTEFRRRNQSTECSMDCRFLAKVDFNSGDCWEWTGSHETGGYGHMRSGNTTVKAHRFSYEMLVRPIPQGLEIDHLCRNRACVNPDHLEPVTDHENWIRGNQPGAIVVRTGMCKKGHSMDDAIIRPNGYRRCRKCRNEQKRWAYAEARKAQTNA